MEAGSRRPFHLLGTAVGMLGQDGLRSQRLRPGSPPTGSGLRLDRGHLPLDTLPVLLFRQMLQQGGVGPSRSPGWRTRTGRAPPAGGGRRTPGYGRTSSPSAARRPGARGRSGPPASPRTLHEILLWAVRGVIYRSLSTCALSSSLITIAW